MDEREAERIVPEHVLASEILDRMPIGPPQQGLHESFTSLQLLSLDFIL